MKNFKQIDKDDVWPYLQAGRKVYAVIFNSVLFIEGVHDLTINWSVNKIVRLLREDDVAFFEELTKEKEEDE